MLHIIITLIFYFIVSTGYGFLTDAYLNKKNLISIRLINGLFLIGILSTLFAITIPLNNYYEYFVIVIGVLLFIYNRLWKFKLRINFLFIFLVCIIAFVGSMNAYLYDTFSYYLPTIKWLDTYGFVKGIANYDFNLGQHSLWHILQATFNDTIDPYYKINTFFTLVFLIYSYELKNFKILIFLPLLYLFIASPSPDLVIFILSIVMLSEWLESEKNNMHYLLLLSSIMILVKPIAFVLPVYFFILSLKSWKEYRKVYLVVFAIACLLFFKNLYLTANVIFPLKFSNFSSMVYSIPEEIYDLSAADGKIVTLKHVPNISINMIKSMDLITYYKLLLSNINYTIFLFGSFATIILGYTIYTFFFLKKWTLLTLLLCIKLIFFTIISIQYRFLLDCIVIIIFLELFRFKFNDKLIYSLISLAAFVIVLYPNISKNRVSYFRLAVPYSINNIYKPYNVNVEYVSHQLFNLKYNVVLNYDFSLDVTPLAINREQIYRYVYQKYHAVPIDAKNISKGFVAKKSTDNDIEELNSIFYLIINSRK